MVQMLDVVRYLGNKNVHNWSNGSDDLGPTEQHDPGDPLPRTSFTAWVERLPADSQHSLIRARSRARRLRCRLATALTIEHHTVGARHVLALTGHLDAETAEEFRDTLRAIPLDEGQLLIIDLARVEYCDSSGLAALMAARNHALAGRAEIALTAVPRSITRVLRTLGLDKALPTHTPPRIQEPSTRELARQRASGSHDEPS